jgi:hypothetical protein
MFTSLADLMDQENLDNIETPIDVNLDEAIELAATFEETFAPEVEILAFIDSMQQLEERGVKLEAFAAAEHDVESDQALTMAIGYFNQLVIDAPDLQIAMEEDASKEDKQGKLDKAKSKAKGAGSAIKKFAQNIAKRIADFFQKLFDFNAKKAAAAKKVTAAIKTTGFNEAKIRLSGKGLLLTSGNAFFSAASTGADVASFLNTAAAVDFKAIHSEAYAAMDKDGKSFGDTISKLASAYGKHAKTEGDTTKISLGPIGVKLVIKYADSKVTVTQEKSKLAKTAGMGWESSAPIPRKDVESVGAACVKIYERLSEMKKINVKGDIEKIGKQEDVSPSTRADLNNYLILMTKLTSFHGNVADAGLNMVKGYLSNGKKDVKREDKLKKEDKKKDDKASDKTDDKKSDDSATEE